MKKLLLFLLLPLILGMGPINGGPINFGGAGQALDPGASPTFEDVVLTDLSDGRIPYHVNDTTGLADGPTKTDVDDAVTKKHAQQHAITSTSDHTSTATAGQILKADANGLPVDATNTDTDVASAVSLKHAAVTIDGTSPLSLSGQAISLKNDAADAVTEVDTGALAASDTVVPTSKAVKTVTDTMMLKTGSNLAIGSDADGDMYYRASSKLARLAKGAALAIPRMNSGATAPEWGSAGQIVFPATQNASADPNTLDDYEEGTWTPTLKFGDATTGITYTTQTGWYRKIGSLVWIHGYINLSNNGSASGAATITGIPFTPVTIYGVTVYLNGVSYAGTPNCVLMSTSVIALRGISEAGSVANWTEANFSDTATITVTVTYHIST